MATSQSTGSGRNTTAVEKPDFLRQGIRCALEMVLAGGLVLLVGLPAENTIFFGAVVTLAVVVMVVVLFWALSRQVEQLVTAELEARTRN
jgi:hypothetical protein